MPDPTGAPRNVTGRPSVQAMEVLLNEPLPCLDHGFVRVVDYMGDDTAIVQAARVSYGSGTRTRRDDRGLIRYLMRHRHTTPFEMCEIKLHVKLPIFVARQWIRHRTASVNEISGRYSVLDSEFYLPRPEDLGFQDTHNRQGREGEMAPDQAARVLEILERDALAAHRSYRELVDDHGLARELARLDLTLSTYTQWYWKIDLHNLLHFLALRLDAHAQREIRVYGEVIASVVKSWVPVAWEAFVDYRLRAATLSGPALDLVRALLAGRDADPISHGLSKGEWEELREVLSLQCVDPADVPVRGEEPDAR